MQIKNWNIFVINAEKNLISINIKLNIKRERERENVTLMNKYSSKEYIVKSSINIYYIRRKKNFLSKDDS